MPLRTVNGNPWRYTGRTVLPHGTTEDSILCLTCTNTGGNAVHGSRFGCPETARRAASLVSRGPPNRVTRIEADEEGTTTGGAFGQSERTVIITMTDEIIDRRDDGLSRDELLALPVTVDISTAARALGLGRSTAYDLARCGEFPCRILRIRSSYRVPTAELLKVLGVEPDEPSSLRATA